MNVSGRTEHLFSYGTLQEEAVQLSTFGRRLQGAPDSLPGYKILMIQIQDRDFVAAGAASQHRNLQFTGINSDVVEGFVFAVTRRELEQADAYEPKDYKRVQARLRSGVNAWMYLSDRET
jgi:gamma-glutamylcyclotransferase (GGCT)/AIG2-like uncharacterized protein YtfP